jgi:hypothetical protein
MPSRRRRCHRAAIPDPFLFPLGAAIPSGHGGGAMPDHIEAIDLRKFLLGQHKLREHEEAHLVRCNECMEAMTKVTLEYLEREDSSKDS